MRTLIANAAPVPYALKQEVIEKLGDGFLFEVYGSTELGVVTRARARGPAAQAGLVRHGPTAPSRCASSATTAPTRRAGEPGELFIRTTLAMDGYHQTDEQLSRARRREWKSVGDIAYVDDEGYLYICDRKKDMIISGGVNIYPAEIEAVIHEHPAILDVAVFGIPDDEWGESVHAIVQPRAGRDLDLDELRAFVDERARRLQAAARRTRCATSCRAPSRASCSSGCCATSTGGTADRGLSRLMGSTLSERASLELVAGYGVPTVPTRPRPTPDDAVERRRGARLPGGGEAARRGHRPQDRAWAGPSRRRRRRRRSRGAPRRSSPPRPDDGEVDLLVAPMVVGSRELIAGVHTDEQFGRCVMVGIGGILAEAIADVTFRLVAARPASTPTR